MEVATMMPYRERDSYHLAHPQSYPAYYDPRLANPYPTVATHNLPSQYTSSPHHETRASNTSPVSTRSTSSDEHKPSLPSISNLLGIADGDRPSQQENISPTSQQAPQHLFQQAVQPPQLHYSVPTDPSTTSPDQTALKPTEQRSDSVIEPAASPLPLSQPQQPYYLSSLNNMDPEAQRVTPAHHVVKRTSLPTQQQQQYTTSPYAIPGYMSSPSALSTSSYYSTEASYAAPHPPAHLYTQRPLPSNFPPLPPTITVPFPSGGMPLPHQGNPWEHHHYISASSATSFPQSPDRYVCATCNKAFSRPSSLKIHSHSHTGEKPFKCPHHGCGKAFSVRSNMKRHERGCHAGLGGLAAV